MCEKEAVREIFLNSLFCVKNDNAFGDNAFGDNASR